MLIAPDDLFDWNDGMYELGPNASDDYPFFGANFWRWSRHARMQGFDALGSLPHVKNWTWKSMAGPAQNLKILPL